MALAQSGIDTLTKCEWREMIWISVAFARRRIDTLTKRERQATTWISLSLNEDGLQVMSETSKSNICCHVLPVGTIKGMKNKYETLKPFQAEVIKEGVRAGFFIANQYNDLGIKFSYLLSSSLSTAPDELEVVNHMIANVASAVCKSSKFVGPSQDNTFKAHMLPLTMKQKKLLEYHKLTHSIYCAVIGMRSVGSARLSKEQIIVQVDWANMGGESD
ncbi:hypothetical protein P692DRAFT_201857223 [Suillus brevipes Sb2]|nr:hypothetical protein P692DRAFT_201857223 [Suillus brevipes Sb2]